jgi:hypothetical protein
VPCRTHLRKSNESCVDCFTADLLALDPKSSCVRTTLLQLLGRFAKLTLREEDLKCCRAIIAEVNRGLIEENLYFGETIQDTQIREEDRLAYRARLRQMGTWIGYYEFTVLAKVYNVGFYIAMPSATPGRWRRYPIGEGPYQRHMVLCWNGTHYDLAKLTPAPEDLEFTAATAREINPWGNCGLEAFLLLIVLSGVGRKPTNGQGKMLALEVRHAFKGVVKLAGQKVVPSDDPHYKRAIRKLRELLAVEMSNTQVELAITAEGELPSTRNLPSWHQIMRVEEARALVRERNDLKPVVVGVMDGGFDVGHDKLRGHIKQVKAGNDQDHGTLCCGLIIGEPEEQDQYLGGIARRDDYNYMLQVSLAVAAFTSEGAGADIARCDALRRLGARVISISYGVPDERLAVMGEAIRRSNSEPESKPKSRSKPKPNSKSPRDPCTFVVAAGNEGERYGFEFVMLGQHAIVVAATSVYYVGGRYVERGINDCNRGPGVTVCAPGSGTHVPSHRDGDLDVISTKPGNNYGLHANTSAATPMVAGVIALMSSINPRLTPPEIKQILCLTAKKIDLLGGDWKTASNVLNPALIPEGLAEHSYSERYGFGRVDAYAAVREVIARGV